MKQRPTPYQYRSGLPAWETFRQPGARISISSTVSPASFASVPKPLRFFPLPEIINTGITLDPFIDYQDEYLLFAGANRDDNIGIIDLYVSYKDGGGNWGQPANLGEGISTEGIDRFPLVTRDGKYLFFVTSHSDHFPSAETHFYWLDAGVLDE